jgi:hypothetical protein
MEIKKERTTGELINDSFSFVSKNFIGLYKPILLIASPFALISAFFYSKIQLSAITEQEYGNPVFNNAIYIGSLLAANVLLYGVVYGYIYFYIKQGKGTFGIEDIWTFVSHHISKILGGLMFMVLFVVLGLFFFIIPGIYLLITLLFFVAVLLFEGLDYKTAFLRCLMIIRGKWWSTFGLVMLVNGIILVFGVIIKIPEIIYTMLLKTNLAKTVDSLPLQFSIVATTTQFLIFFLQIFPLLLIVFQYFNINEARLKQDALSVVVENV